MSGFEIAGIVLGAFPLALEGIKTARSYLECLETWWEYEAELEDFISSLENESMSFSQNLEILLRPLDLAESDENALLLGDVKAWNEPDFLLDLRNRIGERYYDGFSRRLRDIKSALDEISQLLPMENGKIAYMRSTPVEEELQRLMFSINRRRDPLMTRIRNINDFLYKHLHRDSLIPRKVASKHKFSFIKLQTNALAFIRELQRNWSCSCATTHQLGITTEWPESVAGRQVAAKGNLKIVIESPKEWSLVTLDFKKPDTEDVKSVPAKSLTQLTSELQAHMDLKKHAKNIKTAADQKRISLAAVTTTSAAIKPSGTTTELLWKDKSKKLLKSALKPLRKGNKGATAVPMGGDGGQVGFVDLPVLIEPPVAGSAPMPTVDICLMLKGQITGPSIGSIRIDDDEHVSFNLNEVDQIHIQGSTRKTLNDYSFSAAPLRDRMLVGLNIFRTVISLGTTTWIPSSWSQNDIYVLQAQDSSRFTNWPYFQHLSLSKTIHSSAMPARQQTEASLFTLGVVLLELLYKQNLEQQPFRAEYMNNGKPNNYTDLCTAKRWQESVSQDFDEPIAEVIRQCIDCAFQPRANLGDPKFLQAVVSGVLAPLEEFVQSLA